MRLPEDIQKLTQTQKDELLSHYLQLHDKLSDAIEERDAFEGMRQTHPAIYKSIADRLAELVGLPHVLVEASKPYAQPTNAGIPSAPAPAGRRAAKLLDALSSITWAIFKEGQFTQECHDFKCHVIERLKADGWRVSVKSNDDWQVLPPKLGKKN